MGDAFSVRLLSSLVTNCKHYFSIFVNSMTLPLYEISLTQLYLSTLNFKKRNQRCLYFSSFCQMSTDHTEKFSHQMVEKQRPYSNKIRLIKERFAINIAAITYSMKIL